MEFKMYRNDEVEANVAQSQAETGISLQQSLSAFIAKVYWWMAFALGITALCAWGVGTSPELSTLILKNPMMFIGLIVVEVGLVVAISGFINRISASTATALFIAYAALNGATLSWIFIAYKIGTLGTAFGLTAGLFGIMALYGTITRRDLTSIGNILFMALI